MLILKVALLQMLGGNDIAANIQKAERFCREAKALGADIAVFPELWSCGYTPPPKDVAARESWLAAAQPKDGAFVQHFATLARELEMAVLATHVERDGDHLHNSATLVDRFGVPRLTYRKVHTVDDKWEAIFTPGEEYGVAELDTAAGPVQIGTMICYDREFPEAARILMLQGAELLLVPNACLVEANRIAQLRTRAFENMVGVAMTNYAAPQQNGHSMAFDGMRSADGTHDPLLVEASGAEGISIASFDLSALREHRAHDRWGNAYRKPRTYGLLLDPEVHPPFLRKDARR